MKFSFNRISWKLLIVSASFTLPIAVMLNLMVKAKQKDIDFAAWELKGNSYQRPLEKLLKTVSLHRWHTARTLLGDTSSATTITALEQGFGPQFAELQAAQAQYGLDLQFEPTGLAKRQRLEFTVEGFKTKWDKLMSSKASLTVDESELQHKALVAHLKTMITHAGDTSNLILDPDLDSYYLMDVTLLAQPQLQDRLQEIASFTERMYAKGSMNADERLQASVFSSFLREADLDRATASTQTALNEDQNFYGLSPSLQTNLLAGSKAHVDAVTPVITKLKEFAMLEKPSTFDLPSFRAALNTAVDAAYIYHFIGIDELDKLLQTRIAFFEGQKTDAVRWTALSLLLSSILAFLITFNIIKRVKSFNSTTKIISGGDLTARVRMNSGDEIGELANSFDSMTDNIVALNSEIAAKNEELKGINQNLEKIVEERTSTIKVILDNVKFGFFLIDRSLNIQEGFSKSCIDLLGKNLKSGTPILNALGVAGTRNAPMVGEFLNQAFEDFLPEEMTLQQLPSRVQLGEKILSLISSPVRDQNNAVKSILFTVIDATNLEKMEKENERHKVLVRLLKEFDSFKDFLDETKTRLGMCRNFVKQNDQTKVRGELHTMKGNTAAYDMVDIAKLIHAIEDGPKVESADIDRIEAAFVGFLEHNYDVLQLGWNGEAEESYSVSKGDLAAVINRVKTSGGADLKAITELTHWATTIQFKTARSLVGALPDYAERLASRLGKDCKVRIDGGDVRMDSEIMRPIMQSMVHLVRNAIDHGIELPHLRSGKAEQGIVEIACSENTKEWLVVIKDDGRGIDTDAIVARAITTGALTKEKAAALKPDDRCRLVFLNGVTTSESISDISGRGVGMGAVEASVIEAGGQLRISSTRGIGTTVTIAVPKLSNMVKRKAA